MSLTIGYSTLSSRVQNISKPNLSAHPTWNILITVQSGDETTPTVSGKDVLVYPGRGVTKIRNKVIENATGEYLVFADDDITFDLDNLAKAVEHMKQNGTALLLGCAVDETGKLRKTYPTEITPLNKFNSAKAATYEMIVDLKQIRSKNIRFDENFGAGAPVTYLGDEYIFICDAIDAGLKCEFVPIVLASHPSVSSGSGWGTERDRIARALIFDRAFKSTTALPYFARIGFGLRKVGKELSLLNYLKFIFKK